MEATFKLQEAESQQKYPVICDSPHSGNLFPEGVIPEAFHPVLRRWQDRFVHHIIADAPQIGIPMLSANYSRSFLDLNRHVMDLDDKMLKETPQGFEAKRRTASNVQGLFKRFGPNGEELFPHPMSYNEMQKLIDTYYTPYHVELTNLINQTKQTFGKAIHLNWHSMYSFDTQNNPRPDFVISDNMGTTCSIELTKFVKTTLEDYGYSVQVNDPFKGGEIVQQYGKPEDDVHSLQIEIRKALYMSEQTYEKHEGFNDLQHMIRDFLDKTGKWSLDFIRK